MESYRKLLYGHRMGQRWVSKDGKRGIIVLPKNCSTTVRKTIDNYHLSWTWHETMYHEDQPIEFLGILRDPWKRYVSGVLQGLRVKKFMRSLKHTSDENIRRPYNFYPPPYERYRRHDYLYDEIFIKRKDGDWPNGIPKPFFEPYRKLTTDTTLLIDEHTVPQFLMLSPFIGSKIKFIKMENEHFNEELLDWLGGSELYIDGLGTDKHPKFNLFFDYFEENLLENKEWYAKWETIFKEDWWVYNNLKIRTTDEYTQVLNQLQRRE